MTTRLPALPAQQHPARHEDLPSGISVPDILFVIFKHKWKILFFTLAGLIAAAAVYFTQASTYQSEAKLLVRYILDRNMLDPVQDNSVGYGRANDSVMNAELEILTSWDLATQVAEAVGPEQLAPSARGNPSNLVLAAKAVQSGLSVVPRGNVIAVTYRNESPALATKVLQELITRYFTKHLEVHRSAGAFDFVTQQADQIRGRLTQTEEQLKRIKDKAGIISLVESTNASSTEIARLKLGLETAETERAEQIARVEALEKYLTGGGKGASSGGSAAAANSPAPRVAREADVQEYQALMTRLTQLRQGELELLTKYRPENQQVQIVRSQIGDLERRRAALAAKFPELASKSSTGGSASQGPDLGAERTRVISLDARIAALKSRLAAAQERAEQIAALTPQITQLERQKEVEENNYKYFTASLEKARVDEALDPKKIPNISMVQKPSIAFRTIGGTLRKTLIQLAFGGLFLGLALAFLIEKVLDQTIKRPAEFERRLRIPLLVSIPRLKNRPSTNGLALPSRNGNGDGSNGESKAIQLAPRRNGLAPWDAGHFIRPFAEAIRDRLGLYFELNNMMHKPKLVAVTGFQEGGGTSTIAGGVAAALSEMGEGRVLLVDMNIGRPELHPFFEGKPAHSLAHALQPASDIAPAADNLYLASPFTPEDPKQGPLTPKRLHQLMPTLKASTFDYIIFDMPSLDQSSLAISMAGLMDKVLLVAEAEKCGASMVRRAYQELTATRPNVSCVLNKTKSYGPKMAKAEA